MNSPYVPAGLEVVPTSRVSQPPTSTSLRSRSSSTDLSPASSASIAVFLSLCSLAALGMRYTPYREITSPTSHGEAFVICWTRRRRRTPSSKEQPLEKETVTDVEALAATHPITIPVTPRSDVRWAPQIRSISGPALDKISDRRLAALPSKRTRSPPPLNKTQYMFPDAHAKSAPAHALSFPQSDSHCQAKGLRDLSPPVTPQALAVSGMQTRSLGKSSTGSELVV